MIASIRGKILAKRFSQLIIDVQGLGYAVTVGKEALEKPEGSEMQLFTYHHIREDIDALFGFPSLHHLDMFEQLLTVQGVGPKVALSILDLASLEKLASAIVSKDDAFLSSVPGIGKKTAAKIILELSNKVSGTFTSSSTTNEPQTASVVDALMGLGYSMSDVRSVLSFLDPKQSLEGQVKQSLALLRKRK